MPEYEGIAYDLVIDGKIMQENLRKIESLEDEIKIDDEIENILVNNYKIENIQFFIDN